MKTKKTKIHCQEVDKLMNGKMPFITRHGISLLFLLLLCIGVILYFSDGTAQRLITEIVAHTIKKSSLKF